MYDWKVEMNTLTLDLTNQEDKWILDSVKGTNPVSATFNESTMIGVDGVTINGSKRSKRNLVFMLDIVGDCEANREELYQFFTPKSAAFLMEAVISLKRFSVSSAFSKLEPKGACA